MYKKYKNNLKFKNTTYMYIYYINRFIQFEKNIAIDAFCAIRRINRYRDSYSSAFKRIIANFLLSPDTFHVPENSVAQFATKKDFSWRKTEKRFNQRRQRMQDRRWKMHPLCIPLFAQGLLLNHHPLYAYDGLI